MLLQFSRSVWSAILVATLLLPVGSGAAQPASILIMGDSLSAAHGMAPTQSWVTLLEQRLKREGYSYRVINASASGETTTGGRVRLARALQLHRPQILILELGSNDGLRGLPLWQMRANLDAMIKEAKQQDAQVVLIGMRIPPNYGPDYSSRFEATFGELAVEHRLPWIGFLLERVALDPQLMQADQLHPTAAAQPILLENVWPALQPLLERQTTGSAMAEGR